MSFEESSAYRRYVTSKGNQLVVTADCPKHLRRALAQLIHRQQAFDEIRDNNVKMSMTRPGSLNPRKR